MQMLFHSLLEMVEYFDTEAKCADYIALQRWGDKRVCLHCSHDKLYKFSDCIRYKCAGCKKQFTVRTGTIFEDSKIPLKKWLFAMYLHSSRKKGISSHQLAKDIRVTQKTAWFMLCRIRHIESYDNANGKQLRGVVEADETFVGGKNRNRHKDKKVANSQGRAFKDKTPILGLMERDGRVRTVVIPSTSREYIHPVVIKHVRIGSTLKTDEWQGYTGLKRYFHHHIVDHSRKQYVNGDTHTNNIEGFWAWIKRAIMGIYHVVSRKHLQYYADEATFRYNTRDMSDSNRLSFELSIPHTPLKYKQLIAA